MKRELKKEELGKVYKEFSRQKYNKYKHQYPRMRENQLVTKIIKEWESLNIKEKTMLYKSYSQNQEIKSQGSESSNKKESPGSSKQKRKDSSTSQGKRGREVVSTPSKQKKSVQVFNKSSSSKKQRDQSQQSDFQREGEKKINQNQFQLDSAEVGKKFGQKNKKIRKQVKQPRTQYLKFYKFYYEKLSKEHKKWSTNQIAIIIKLLWKKKQHQDRLQKKASRNLNPRQLKKMSGRMAFRKNFGYNGLQGFERWKQLPTQSKQYWRFKGLGTSLQRKSVEPNITFRSTRRARKGSSQSNDESFAEKFSFLLKQIQ